MSTFRVAQPVAYLAVHRSIVWALSDIKEQGGYLLRLVDGTASAQTRTGIVPYSIAYGHGSVWVANGHGAGIVYNSMSKGPGFPSEDSVQRVDPATGRVVATLRLSDPFALAVSQSDVWSLGQEQGTTVLRPIDPQTNAVGPPIHLLGRPLAVRAASSAVWALTSGGHMGGRLYKVDAVEKRILNVTPVPALTTSDMAIAGSSLWIMLTGLDGELVSVDLSTGELNGLRRPYSYPQTLAGSVDILWLTSEDQEGMGRIQALDARSGQVIAAGPNEYGARIRALSGGTAWGVSEDGRRIVELRVE